MTKRVCHDFMGHGSIVSVSDFAHSQLLNPAENTLNMFVTSIACSTDTTAVIQWNKQVGVILADQVDSIRSLDFSHEAVSLGQIRTEDRATLVDGEFNALLYPFHNITQYQLRKPIKLVPGTSLIVTITMRAAELFVVYEWQETDAGYYTAQGREATFYYVG